MVEVKKEEIQDKNKFIQNNLSQEKVKKSLDYCLKTVDNLLQKCGKDLFPTSCSKNGKYSFIDNFNWTEDRHPDNWTNGFWSGINWLSYLYSGDKKYLEVAQNHSRLFKERLENYYNGKRRISELDHHDIGFLYLLSTKADYQITGSPEALETTLRSADILMKRFIPKAGILQAWGDKNDPTQSGRLIIDCNLNVPLLYFVNEKTGNEDYKNAADSHLNVAVNNLVREDASTFHTYYMDVDTGKPKYGNTFQGFSDESCWARGQAWGILGFSLAYRYNKNPIFIETAEKLANYFLNRLPDNLICNWDLIFTNNDGQRDTSAAAIAAIGLLELSKYSKEKIYPEAAKSIANALIDYYQGEDYEGLVRSGVYHFKGQLGINEYLIFGDYYFMELLVRLNQEFNLFW